MEHGQVVLVACDIEAGAFSGERIFHLKMADGMTDYSGVAPMHYFFRSDRSPLVKDEPTASNSISGFVAAFLISNGGSVATVEFPDGEAVEVDVSLVPFRRYRDMESTYVPVRS